MIKLFRYIFGFVMFEFSGGFIDGFVNACYLEQINIHDVKIKDNVLCANCPVSEYKRLHKIAFKYGGRVKIIKKHGAPFIINKLKNRAGLMVGIVVFIVIINTLSGFVWNVEIVGNDKLTTTEISTFLEQNGVHNGVHWHSFSTDKIENLMMACFEDIAWVHINRIGSTARVEINESVLQPAVDDTDGYANLKATKDGVISYINLKRGWSVVNVGDAVVKGDLLASGVFENELTERNDFVHSAGEVLAEVKEPFELTVSRSQAERIYTDTRSYRAVCFFGLTVGKCGKSGWQNEQNAEYITLNGRALPVGIIKTKSCAYVDTERSLTDDELTELISSEVDARLKDLFGDNEIIEQNISISLDSDSATATGELKVLENIATEVKFY